MGNSTMSPANGSELLRSRIARHVFHYCESVGMSDRQRMEQLTGEVIQRLERAYLPLPGMDTVIPESRLTPHAIQDIVKQILAEGSQMEIATRPTAPKKRQRGKTAAKSPVVEAAKPSRFSHTALTVLQKRYLEKDESGHVIETPDDLFRRVAHNIASAESLYNDGDDVMYWENEFYQVMANLEFLPNSPTLMNAGRELQQLSACFVLPIEDSMESIFEAIKDTALIHKSGGGTGFSFSRLRPEGDVVGSTGGVASGPVSFMKAFDTATDVIKQGGTRRGANMAILSVNHPDILRFIAAKEKGNNLTNFNLSVAANDDFMKAVQAGTDYALINPRNGAVDGRLNATEAFDQIVDHAWRTGDPGLVFLDRINEHNPTPQLGTIESTNPCGEQPLLPFESCNLGSVNLAKMVRDDARSAGAFRERIDWTRLERTVCLAVRFLDNVIDMNEFPLPQIEEMTKKTRKIGLGVMGFADLLIKLGLPYDSEEALQAADEVMHFIDEKATEASAKLADERGVFPAFHGSIYEVPTGPRVRNATATTIAPTGTLSIIAGCSSGIEPLFALSYVRNILDGAGFVEANPYFEQVARKEGFYSDELMADVAKRGTIRDIEGIPQWVKRLFVTAHDISPEWHVRMQAAFQRSTHNAVSKTINFPHSATREDVAQAYTLAYKLGCKGITVYRDRSKDAQVLNIAAEEEEAVEARAPRRRAKVTTGVTERVATGCGSIYVTVNSDADGVCEVFSTLGKAGGCASAQLEAISRLISLALRSGVDIESVVKHLKGIRCPSIAWEEGHSVLSCPDAIGTVLEKHVARTEAPTGPKGAKDSGGNGHMANTGGHCPECGGMLVYQEGCHICHACGYTKCS